MSRYMLILVLSVIVPALVSLWPPLGFWRNWRALLGSLSLVIVVFGIWDMFATWRGHWHFDPAGVYGLTIVNLPLEEWLFFAAIPFCSLFTWEVVKFVKGRWL